MCEAHLNSPSSAGAVWNEKWAKAGHIPSVVLCICLHLLVSWPNMMEMDQGQPKCSGSQKPLPNMVLRLPKETNVVHVSAHGVVGSFSEKLEIIEVEKGNNFACSSLF